MIIKPPYNGPQFWDGGKTLDLYFARDKALDSRVTFTRASSATYYDASGVLQTAGTDVARFDHDNFRTNLLTYSEDFSNGAWAKAGNGTGSAAAVTPNDAIAPDGELTADLIVLDRGAGNTLSDSSNISQNSISFTNGVTYSGGLFIKAATVGDVGKEIAIRHAEGSAYDVFTLTTTWQRVSGAETATSSYAGGFEIASRGGVTADNTVSFHAWGAQLETGSTATSYIKTTSAAVTVGESLGLLVEGAGTNLLQRSEEFDNAYWTKFDATITANAITAPDGTLTGEKFLEDSGAGKIPQIYRVGATASNVTHTLSVYAKAAERNWLVINNNDGIGSYRAWFNLATGAVGTVDAGITADIHDCGNGWYRCQVSRLTGTFAAALSGFQIATSNGGSAYTANGTSGIYIWGAQLETGTRASSYIKTVASTVTRAADSASMTGTNFSQWFNAGEGTFSIEFQAGGAGDEFPLSVGQENVNEMAPYRNNSVNDMYLYVTASSVTQANISIGDYPASGACKFAFSYGSAAVNASVDGAAIVGATPVTIPSVSAAYIGTRSPGTNPLNGHITRLIYYPTRLTNGNLVELTNGTVRQ